MSVVDNLIDQVAQATGLGPDARKFVGVLASFIFKQPDGFLGFRKKFQNAGLGGMFDSWSSNSPSMQRVDAAQIQNALGERNLHAIADKAGVPKSLIGSMAATALPLLVRAVTKGGVMPNGLPSALAGLTGIDTDWGGRGGAGGVHRTGKRRSLWRWLLPILALLALAYCGWHMRTVKTLPPPTQEPAAAPVASTDGTATAVTAPRFSFENMAGKVKVGGTLATTAEKFQLLDGLKSTFGADNVSGDLSVDPSVKPASWLDRLKGMLPSLKGNGLKFGFEGDTATLDTSRLPEAEQVAVSSLFQKQLPNVEVKGLFDRGVEAIKGLKVGYSAADLTKALNLTTVRFGTGSANLTRSSEEIIRKAAEAIQGAPAGTRVEVGGHTDDQGDSVANQALSEQRAKAVVAALIQAGVPADRLAARGFGSNRPVADNGTDAGRAANRRIAYEVRQ